MTGGTKFLGALANLFAELGLTALATQAPNAVAITGGSVTGLTSLSTSGNATIGGSVQCSNWLYGCTQGTYGSIGVLGSQNGWNGIAFNDNAGYASGTFMVQTGTNTPTTGFWNGTSGWLWNWTGGTLTIGTVPVARTTGGSSAALWSNVDNALTGYGLALAQVPQTLAYASTVAWSLTAGVTFYLTLSGNVTMGTPTGATNGRIYTLIVIQDGTGSRTLAWPSFFDWGSAGAPVLSTAANARDVLTFLYDSATGKAYSFASGFGF